MLWKALLILMVATFLAALLPACNNESSTQALSTPTAPPPEYLAQHNFALPQLPRITCEELKRLMDAGGDVVLVDTRAPSVFASDHLPEAINIAYDAAPSLTPQTMAALRKLPGDGLIVFYCD